ncbi:MAG: hypothetical protein JSR48_05100 [Verrucomicrobia bacterium]|nr:hypothetical protein [Verrucomicrobiota bacterium]
MKPRSRRSAPRPVEPAPDISGRPGGASVMPWIALVLVVAAANLTIYFNPGLLWYLGVQHYNFWFADVFALLASNDAVAQGLNPYAVNPLDVFGRPHVYSHWWLEMRHLGLTRADQAWLGPTIVVLFVVAAVAWLRPGTWRQFAAAVPVMIASPMLLACDRANNDLIVFLVLTPLVPCLLSPRPAVRWFAPVSVAVAAGLKYYPAAAGLLLLAPSGTVHERRLRLLAGVALLMLVGWSVAPDLAIFGPLAPKPSGWMSFGAVGLRQELQWNSPLATVVFVALGVGLAAWAWRTPLLASWTPAPDQQGHWLRFVLGAVVLTGCFFASANFSYRWVFALWLPPLLWSLAGDAAAPAPARALARVTGVLLLAVLWLDTIYSWVIIASRNHFPPDVMHAWVKWSYVAEQPVTWAFFSCLLVFLARFTRIGIATLIAR